MLAGSHHYLSLGSSWIEWKKNPTSRLSVVRKVDRLYIQCLSFFGAAERIGCLVVPIRTWHTVAALRPEKSEKLYL